MTTWIQISSGRGPLECCRAVALVAPLLKADLAAEDLDIRTIERIETGTRSTLRSVTYSSLPTPSTDLIAKWEGTHQWRQQSPFRLNHKRKNWFIGVSFLEIPDEATIEHSDIALEAYKGSGAGGQHRNKNETAIRAIHLPTKTIAVANEERSRKMNERLAIWRLEQKLKSKMYSLKLNQQYDRWNLHNQLIRGNPKQIFTGTSTLKTIR